MTTILSTWFSSPPSLSLSPSLLPPGRSSLLRGWELLCLLLNFFPPNKFDAFLQRLLSKHGGDGRAVGTGAGTERAVGTGAGTERAVGVGAGAERAVGVGVGDGRAFCPGAEQAARSSSVDVGLDFANNKIISSGSGNGARGLAEDLIGNMVSSKKGSKKIPNVRANQTSTVAYNSFITRRVGVKLTKARSD